jgi:hypothetical protein
MPGILDRVFGWPMRATPEAREAAAWIETVNPLRGMTVRRAQAIFDSARSGNTVQLQWLYHEIEAADPTLMICAERRGGMLQSLDWTIRARAESRTPGYDQGLVDEQTAMLEGLYGRLDAANLSDAVEHLSSAFFRGFAHAAPVWSADGREALSFDLLDAWNFCRDIGAGAWYWNPAGRATGGTEGLAAIPADELVSLVRTRHIDYPALAIYLRIAVGERAWGQFIERYGIPPVIITMPPDIPAGQEDTYKAAAEAVAQGACGALPNGSAVSYADSARGVNPFQPFLDHQQRLIVLMATGGLLTSLAESGSGTLAGGAHADTWREVWRRDAAVIADAMNRTLTRLALDRAFPGRPRLAYWALDTETPPSAADVFESATKARAAGYLVDQAQLEEETGYRLVPSPETPPGPPSGALFAANRRRPLCNSTKPLCNSAAANQTPEGEGPGEAALNAILEAFKGDWRSLAEKLASLAGLPDAERRYEAANLLASLTGYAPEDPALADAVEQLLATRFTEDLQP